MGFRPSMRRGTPPDRRGQLVPIQKQVETAAARLRTCLMMLERGSRACNERQLELRRKEYVAICEQAGCQPDASLVAQVEAAQSSDTGPEPIAA